MGAQRRQRGKPQHTGPHLRFSGCAGRRSAWFSLLPFCQTASAFRLICLFHTFFRRGVYRAMVFAPLRCPNLFRFPFACLRAAPSVRFAHLFSQSTLTAGKDRRYMQDEAERFGGGLLNRIAPVGVWFVSTVLHQISRKGAEAWPRYLQLLQSCIDHDPQWGNEHQCLHIQLLLQSRIL